MVMGNFIFVFGIKLCVFLGNCEILIFVCVRKEVFFFCLKKEKKKDRKKAREEIYYI